MRWLAAGCFIFIAAVWVVLGVAARDTQWSLATVLAGCAAVFATAGLYGALREEFDQEGADK